MNGTWEPSWVFEAIVEEAALKIDFTPSYGPGRVGNRADPEGRARPGAGSVRPQRLRGRVAQTRGTGQRDRPAAVGGDADSMTWSSRWRWPRRPHAASMPARLRAGSAAAERADAGGQRMTTQLSAYADPQAEAAGAVSAVVASLPVSFPDPQRPHRTSSPSPAMPARPDGAAAAIRREARVLWFSRRVAKDPAELARRRRSRRRGSGAGPAVGRKRSAGPGQRERARRNRRCARGRRPARLGCRCRTPERTP